MCRSFKEKYGWSRIELLLTINLLAFKEIDCLPSNMFPWLKEDEVSEDTLRSHKAKWHDSCILQYNKTEVERAAKRKAAPAVCEVFPMKKYTRTSIRHSVETELEFLRNVQTTRGSYLLS